MKKISFKRYLRMIETAEFFIYFSVILFVYFLILPVLNLSVVLDVILTMLTLTFVFAFVAVYRKRMIAIDASNRSYYFFNTLDTSELEGMSEYFIGKVKKSSNPIAKANNEFMAYLLHDYTSNETFPLYNAIKATEEAYDDYYYDRILYIRSIMIYREMEKGNIEESLSLCKKQLAYIEKMIDEDQVPEEEVETVLNYSSTYRHMIRFIESTNIRTALAIKVPENTTNYDKVNKYFFMSKVFIEKDMKPQAKAVIENILDIDGDYRLLVEMKEQYNVL